MTTANTNICIDSILVLVYKVPGVSLLKGFLNFGICRIGLAHEQVLLDGRVKEHRLLTDIANLLAVVAKVDALQVLSIDENFSVVRVVESLN